MFSPCSPCSLWFNFYIFSLRGHVDGRNALSKIIRREIPADIVYEDDEILAFRDINPQAPVHVLFIPKKAVATLDDLTEDDAAAVGSSCSPRRAMRRQKVSRRTAIAS